MSDRGESVDDAPGAGNAGGGGGVSDDSRSLGRTDSPCVALCSTLYDDVCRGCGRTVMEVANWVFMSDEEKRRVWERIRAQGYPRQR